MLNSVGLANPGLAHVREAEMPWLLGRLRAARVLVNVVGFTLEEYAAVIEGLDDLDGITAYELNLSCPNTAAGGIEFGADPASVSAIIARCRRVTKRPLVAKLSPVLPDIAGMAVVARDAGADGGVRGQHPARPRARSARQCRASATATAASAARRCSRSGCSRCGGCVSARADFPVIGLGGVRSADDARQYLAAGASLVGIGTGGMADPRLPGRIIRDLERRHG